MPKSRWISDTCADTIGERLHQNPYCDNVSRDFVPGDLGLCVRWSPPRHFTDAPGQVRPGSIEDEIDAIPYRTASSAITRPVSLARQRPDRGHDQRGLHGVPERQPIGAVGVVPRADEAVASRSTPNPKTNPVATGNARATGPRVRPRAIHKSRFDLAEAAPATCAAGVWGTPNYCTTCPFGQRSRQGTRPSTLWSIQVGR